MKPTAKTAKTSATAPKTANAAPLHSYLDLAARSARTHQRQSRMTRACIVLAVFLVTAIFAMADMELRNQRTQAIQEYGNWHVSTAALPADSAAVLAARPDVEAVGLYAVQNYDLDEGYFLQGKPLVVIGGDAGYLGDIAPLKITSGRLPQAADEILLTENAVAQLGLAPAKKVAITLPGGGSAAYTIVGTIATTALLSQNDAMGAVLTLAGDYALCGGEEHSGGLTTYVRFAPLSNMQKAITEIEQSFALPADTLRENPRLMTLSFQSSNSYFVALYGTAGILFVLVCAAGIFMIAGTLNSSLANRTAFFGMLRCLGATRRQILRYVRREALLWCVTAIPLGLALGSAVTWVLCAMLRVLSPSYFYGMPVFGLSPIALVCGTVLGLATVLLAARAPAKRAAAVSPLTAVSGNAGGVGSTVHLRRRKGLRPGKQVVLALGIHHATGAKKNLALVAGSFALSVVLFLSFSAALDFMHHAFRPLRPYTPDVSIISADNTCSLGGDVLAGVAGAAGVKRAYGRSFAYSLPAAVGGQTVSVNLISYEANQYRWAKEELLAGAIDPEAPATALTVYDAANPVAVGDALTLPGGSVTVGGLLSTSPFDRDEGEIVVIVNEETFQTLTGESGYTILDIQLKNNATEADVAALRALAEGASAKFSDQRQSNREVQGAYLAIAVFFYGFEVVITLIAVLNILNSVSMSAAARTAQYGAMRAIGLSAAQLRRMLLAESLTYAALGSALGTALGVPLHRLLYTTMVTNQWGTQWALPLAPLALILALTAASAILATRAPARRLTARPVVETIAQQ